jgi:hypothetical protein
VYPSDRLLQKQTLRYRQRAKSKSSLKRTAKSLSSFQRTFAFSPCLVRCLVVFLFGGNPRSKNAAKPSGNPNVGASANSFVQLRVCLRRGQCINSAPLKLACIKSALRIIQRLKPLLVIRSPPSLTRRYANADWEY